jgi:hypothetical protein
MVERKRKPKAGVLRTEVFAMRLDPKLKYLLELAARKQRRSIANYIESAIEAALRGTVIDEANNRSVWNEAGELWDISEPARLLNLTKLHPELLTYQEQIILKAIYDIGNVDFSDKARTKSYAFYANGEPNLANIEACWDELVKFADGQISQDELKAEMAEKIKRPVTSRQDLDPLKILGRRRG